MKSLFATAAAVVVSITSSSTLGAVYSIGSPLASNCYSSALNEVKDRFAVEACTRALTEEGLSPADRAATLVNRGIIRLHRGELPSADADFDAALLLNGQLTEAYLNKGYLRLRSGDGSNALPLIEKGMSIGGDKDAKAWFARGVAYEQMGKYSLAYADLKQAQALAPDWSMPTEYLADYRVGR